VPSKASRDLVVDASVARSAGGEEATYPTSKNCRDCLKAILALPHRVVMSQPITDEWNKHKSAFARTWLVSMTARKRILRVEPEQLTELRQRVQEITDSQKERDAMLKDFHLIEAALATDHTVIALDEIVRALFSMACQTMGQMKSVVWANPDKPEEQPFAWLEGGAEPEKHRQLGFGHTTQ
jgi:hypothetical protein